MKFNCGETRSEYWDRIENWHPWFAWYPVRIGSNDCRWLEHIERKGTWHQSHDPWFTWEYRVPTEKPPAAASPTVEAKS